MRIASARCELGRFMYPDRLHCLDGNGDGNVGSQRQAGADADNLIRMDFNPEQGIRYA
jgi:hypothetical protein